MEDRKQAIQYVDPFTNGSKFKNAGRSQMIRFI